MITVLHLKSEATHDRPSFAKDEVISAFAREQIEKGSYQQVAIVATTSLDEAYELTNSIECPWTQAGNSKVAVTGDDRKRSTDVGDLMIVDAGATDSASGWNCRYVVASTGFAKL